MHKSIFYLRGDEGAKNLYVKLIAEKYVVCLMSGTDETPSLIEKRLKFIKPEDLPRTIIVVACGNSIIAPSLELELKYFTEKEYPIVVCASSAVNIGQSLLTRLVRTNNQAIVMKYLDHFKQKV